MDEIEIVKNEAINTIIEGGTIKDNPYFYGDTNYFLWRDFFLAELQNIQNKKDIISCINNKKGE